MRILDEINDNPLEYVLIMLTISEARQFLRALQKLVPQEDKELDPTNHIHVTDDDLSRQVTIGIYTPSSLQHLHERVRRLVEEN